MNERYIAELKEEIEATKKQLNNLGLNSLDIHKWSVLMGRIEALEDVVADLETLGGVR